MLLKWLIISRFIDLEEILTIQIYSYRYIKYLSCLMCFSFFPLLLCEQTSGGMQIPEMLPTSTQSPAVSSSDCSSPSNRDGKCTNRSTKILARVLCCTPFSQVQVLPGCSQKSIKHYCCPLQIFRCFNNSLIDFNGF